MKVFVILSALVALTVAEKIVYFTTGNDYLDIDKLMKNPVAVKQHVDCFIDVGPCDALSESYKKNMPEAIPTACHRCNNPQKHLWTRFLWALKTQYPTLYLAFQQKYDPKNIYMAAFERAVAGY